MTFSADGTLFVGDNVSSAVFAYKTGLDKPQPMDPKSPLQVESVDERIDQTMKGNSGKIEINGLAVHPTSHEIYLSVSRINNGAISPAVVKVSLSGKISTFDLNAPDRSEFTIADAPTPDEHFADLAAKALVPRPEKYHAKARTSMRSMTIVDMKFHNGELFIAGISNEEFASTLRRVTYPFTDKVSETKVKIYHDAHSQWETRAPSDIKLTDSNGKPIDNVFMDFGSELWSPDGKRLTVLFDPGKVKRGVEDPLSDLSPLKEHESHKIVLGTFEHAFHVTEAVRTRVAPSSWLVPTVTAGSNVVAITFDRVMDAALVEDQIHLEDDAGRLVPCTIRVTDGGLGVRIIPSGALARGRYLISIGELIEDVAGNRMNETLDHSVSEPAGEASGANIWATVQ